MSDDNTDTLGVIKEIGVVIFDMLKAFWQFIVLFFNALRPIVKFIAYILGIIGWFFENIGSFVLFFWTMLSDLFNFIILKTSDLFKKVLTLFEVTLEMIRFVLANIAFFITIVFNLFAFLLTLGKYGKDDSIFVNSSD
jgi:hypothetical protein